MPQGTDLPARLTTLSLLAVPLVMGLPLGAQGAQAQSPRGGIMMAPAHSNIVIHNYPYTAMVGRAAPARTTDTVNPGISLTPSEGRVGSRAAVSGSGFVPHATITVTFDGSSIGTSCATNANGSFSSCAFTVPVVAAGTHAVTAPDGSRTSPRTIYPTTAAASDTTPASVRYTNSGAATSTGTQGIGLNPTSGAVGSRDAAGGSGFAPHSRITLTFDGARVNDPTTCITNATGSFDSCTFTIPAAIAGPHTVAASDTGHTNTAAASYNVEAAISLNWTAGAVGSREVVRGGGFAPNSSIALGFDDDSLATSCTSDAKGSFRCAFTVPEATAGSHTVTALDTTYTNSAEASYTVNPAISLNATNGTVGSSAGVGGRGFAPNNPITVTFDGSGVATACVADVDGSFDSCTFTTPAVSAGTHAVTASDSTAASASAIYTITPDIGLTASAGLGGSRAGVSGRGFAAGPITLSFDGSSVGTSCTANATGSFNYCAFTVPAADAGSHTVTASDRSANSAPASYTYSAAASYTVNSTISLNATAGAVDSAVTLSGSNFKPNSTITVSFDGTALNTSGTCTADDKGNLLASNTCAFTVPAAAAGSSTVTASDGTYSGSATYTITAAIGLSASAGAVGSKVAVSGSGFAPNDTIAVTFDGSSVPTSCTSDATGSVSSCALAVPAATAGAHTVAASGSSVNAAWATYPNSAVASYTVSPAISLGPSAGAVGSTAGVSGNGFAPNSTIAVTFDGSSVPTSCVADANGSFNSCTFTVPTAGAGSHTVRASDSSANSARATYTV